MALTRLHVLFCNAMTPFFPPINRLTEGQLVAMATDAASGLAYLERVGYVHKDVAARNCIVTQDLSVKITGI